MYLVCYKVSISLPYSCFSCCYMNYDNYTMYTSEQVQIQVLKHL